MCFNSNGILNILIEFDYTRFMFQSLISDWICISNSTKHFNHDLIYESGVKQGQQK